MAETTQHSLYNGEVLIDFYPNSHAYKLVGTKKRLCSVTSALGVIAKPALIPWAARTAVEHIEQAVQNGEAITSEVLDAAKNAFRQKRDDAATTGSLVHEWAENYTKFGTQELPEDENVLNGVLAFLKWVKEHSVQFLQAERVVYSRKYGYVGTADALATIDGKLTLIDYKTSSGIYKESHYQTAAYQQAIEEEDGVKCDGGRMIARFDKKTGEFEVVHLPKRKQFNDDFRAFKAALTLKKLS